MKKGFLLFAFFLFAASATQAQEGCLRGNCVDGYGTYNYSNGDSYVGEFVDGERHGRGTYYFANGNIYTGQYVKDRREGYGTFNWSNGDSYIGEYRNDQRNGEGTYISAVTGTEQSGMWNNGTFVGVIVEEIDEDGYTMPVRPNNAVAVAPKPKPPVATGAKPSVQWVVPKLVEEEFDQATYTLKACIKSDVPVSKVEVMVNNGAQVAARGYKVVEVPSCAVALVQDVTLRPGLNEIYIVATNQHGTVTSDKRRVNFVQQSGTQANVPSNQPKRTALIIGNANYGDSPLRNPVNDALAMANELKGLGFEVLYKTDADQRQMKDLFREFGEKLKKSGGVGLFYYAGHGIQIKGRNYLIPVGAHIEKEQDIEYESVDLGRVLSELDYAKNQMNIVILDACRDNPYEKAYRTSEGGLAPINVAPVGTLIAYATSPGSTASDGAGSNGLYTQELIKAMRKPNMKIEDVFKEVRANVRSKSGGVQIPWENSSLEGDFYFKR